MRLLVLTLAIFGFSLSSSFAQDTQRQVSHVAGDVYRFQNNAHAAVFTITGDGVVVTDPINAEAATWLKAEIEKMTDQPISHLVFSHSHGDHVSGGAAFGDVPLVIAHENAPDSIDGVSPNIRFGETLQFKTGSKTFELTYLGPGHGEDLIAMVIRPENVAFVVDAVASKRLFYRDFPGSNVDDWTDQVRAVEALDFATLVGGHGPVGVKADATAGRVYLEELRAAVLEGLQAGKTDDELAESILMEDYEDWLAYERWRELNVRGMARYLRESGLAGAKQ